MAKKTIETDTTKIIKEAVVEGLKAGKISALGESKNAYKDTEKRLYAHAVLLTKIESNREELQDLKNHGLKENSRGISRFSKGGIRVDKADILESLINDQEASIQADTHEIEQIQKALGVIASDKYYNTVHARYIEGKTDDEIAELLACDPTTVRRNRGRLVKKVAIFLYGVQGI